MDLGEKIKNLRIKKNLSQKKLSDLVGCGRANIANIEANRTYPSFQILIKLREILGLNLNGCKIKQEEANEQNNSIPSN